MRPPLSLSPGNIIAWRADDPRDRITEAEHGRDMRERRSGTWRETGDALFARRRTTDERTVAA